MSALPIDQEVTLVEVLAILVGIAIAWLVYRDSDRAELPGEATVPDPAAADDTVVDTRGRTLQ
ncbi:MAG TPA: hypothetical protein VFF67_05240 [Thermoplasmata archaeon]|nr:hypothetical protein [Thermoplasmata archaeon]